MFINVNRKKKILLIKMSTTIITYIFMCMETILIMKMEHLNNFFFNVDFFFNFLFLVLITDCFAFFVVVVVIHFI